MVRYSLLKIKRAIMHRILAVEEQRGYFRVDPNPSLIALDNNIKKLIKDRLVNSCGKQGKSFELEINDDSHESCFDRIKDIGDEADSEFITSSIELAQMLANCQEKKVSTPPGYFLLIEAEQGVGNKLPVYIIMKAEKQDALNDNGTSVQALTNIFLSPAQKLYKAGVFEQVNDNQPRKKEDFKAYLFDSQFNDGTKLAEYFYKDFLGLTINGNSQIQTKLFYDSTVSLIDKCYKNDADQKTKSRDLLRATMLSETTSINAHEVVMNIIPLNDRDRFNSELTDDFPISFTKDTSLIQNKMSRRSLFVGTAIKLTAPTEAFANNGIVMTNDPNDASYKIIRIKVNNE